MKRETRTGSIRDVTENPSGGRKSGEEIGFCPQKKSGNNPKKEESFKFLHPAKEERRETPRISTGGIFKSNDLFRTGVLKTVKGPYYNHFCPHINQ